MSIRGLFALCFLIILSQNCLARSTFSATITDVNNQDFSYVQVIEQHQLKPFISTLESKHLNELFGADNDFIDVFTDEIKVNFNFRGLSADAFFSANSNTLEFIMECRGININFDGDSRDQSVKQLRDWFLGKGNSLLAHCLVENSPNDPVAGNPNSLMAVMLESDFNLASDSNRQYSQDKKAPNQFKIDPRAAALTLDNYEMRAYSIPLSYTVNLNYDQQSLIFSLPLTYIETGGSKAYSGSLGAAYRFRLFDYWYVTPGIRAGGTWSDDLGSAAVIYTANLTNHLEVPKGNWYFSFDNLLGYYKTQKIKVNDVDIDYDLQNTGMRNGIGMEYILNYKWLNKRTSWRFQLIDTRFFGDKLYIERYNDLVFTFGSRREPGEQLWQRLRMGLTYTFGEKNLKGYRFNVGYEF